ncbi:hypothetical protein [Taibaiella helva]|nr:hypothetical protein [Taibaiella helva]
MNLDKVKVKGGATAVGTPTCPIECIIFASQGNACETLKPATICCSN